MIALRMKGETVDEITGAARVMREKSIHIDAGERRSTRRYMRYGRKLANTFNISTTAAFVVAGCGLKSRSMAIDAS